VQRLLSCRSRGTPPALARVPTVAVLRLG
jgi:hypothetical protein